MHKQSQLTPFRTKPLILLNTSVLVCQKAGLRPPLGTCSATRVSWFKLPHHNENFNIRVMEIGQEVEDGQRENKMDVFEPHSFSTLPSLKT